MLPSALEHLRDPESGARLTLRAARERDGHVVEGVLTGAREYEIVDEIPRFCPRDNYATSFGYQWRKYSTTQLDSKTTWDNQSARRLFGESGWPRDLAGERVLEAGCGMGRFTELLAETGAEICTFDYSRAVDANLQNNRRFKNISYAQADIFHPPYERGSFDRVLCIGVLQHTPSPKKAFMSLTRFLRPGGRIFIDSYRLTWKKLLQGKYYLRPITRLLPPEVLHRAVRTHVNLLFPLTGALHDVVGHTIARKLSWALVMADYRGLYPMEEGLARELAELDTFDMLSPAYDRPATIGMVRRWFEHAGLIDVDVRPGLNGIIASGRRPPQP